uniref:C3H1-type domain-containing protein n=1 Tax=Panagrellus redivivus TaxID=6233 RepID=A0A7E4VFQ5_PANRE
MPAQPNAPCLRSAMTEVVETPVPEVKPEVPTATPAAPAPTNNGTSNNTNTPGSANKKRKGKGGGGGGGGGGGPGGDDICRDFLNGICARGNRCRFRHPENENGPTNQPNTPYTFCIDFQNRGCYRESCRFVHATAEDAERYQSKGFVSLPLARAIAATLTINDSINGIPICKEFQTGACSRGNNRCRYWHVVVEEERLARHNMVMHGGPMGPPMGGRGGPPHPPPLGMPHYTPGMRRGAPPPEYDYEPVPAKRAYPGRMPIPGMGAGGDPSAYVASIERRNAELEKETESLRRELEREKHRYEDLMALFKQSQAHAAPAPPPVPMGGHGPQYNWHHDAHGAGWN